jgi:hypothetical protein
MAVVQYCITRAITTAVLYLVEAYDVTAPSLLDTMDTGKKYNTQCTGDALDTVNAHTKDQDITLYASCFCPFVQRVWVALEVLEIPYKVSPCPS